MKSDVQKNWEKVYGKTPKPTENYYYNDSGKFRKNSKIRKTLRGIGIVIVIILALYVKQNFTILTSSTGNKSISFTSNKITQSNKNGKVMSNSINELNSIFSNINSLIMNYDISSIQILNDYIEKINTLHLSSEYDELKNQLIKKLSLGIEYINANNNNDINTYDILKNYNDIIYTNEIKKAFDKASVRYYINNDNSITYQFENK